LTETVVAPPRPLRLWPGVLAVVLQWFGWLTPSTVFPDAAAMYVMLGGLLGGVVLLAVWWLFFSRAPWLERLVALVAVPLAVVVTKPLVHVSIQNGNMGMMLGIYSIPVLSTALVAWAWLSGRVTLSRPARAVAMAGLILLACLGFTLVRTEGVTSAGADLHWRWTPSYEETFLAKADAAVPAPPPAAAAAPTSEPPPASADPSPAKPAARSASTATASTVPEPSPVPAVAEWPGFRGPDRDGVAAGVRIETDWTHSPPVELWRQPVGPGWSSFAVAGDRFYTQEQHGEEEVVSCHDIRTGRRLWKHVDKARFWESNAGAGPRATPTLADGRVYSLGGTGIVNALDAKSGALIWSRNAAVDTEAKTPMWGFAGSPVVTGGLVIVAASGRLAAYDAASGGEPRWKQARGAGYSSPQLMTLDGVPQVVLLTSTGATAVAPADGHVLWEYAWEGVPIVQPGRTADGDLLLTTGGMSGGEGTRRVSVTQADGAWKVEERWASKGLKPYFNDFVVHKGHAYGFDGSILACIDLTDGQRKWKGGRYGQGQLVLLPEQDLLLVLAEEGDLALVKATPDAFAEVSRVRAIEGKTWNHPVLVGDRLLVRNGQEMAAFRLARAGN
jgi:outer membrane protein assembly factor BamB